MDLQKEVRLGKDAIAILDNEAYKHAIKSLKDMVISQWKDCPIRDKEGQVLLLQLAKLTEKFESVFIGLVENGKLANHKIELDNLRDEPAYRRMARKVIG
jgi:hypothetical protein